MKIQIKSSRLIAVDALRGLIIILMALDHANHFVAQKHPPGEHWGGNFPVYDSALPFLTRLVTHLAAPGFFFLMGVGMLLFAQRRRKDGWSRWAIIRHFLIRGTLLIGLQLFVVNRAWKLSPGGWGLNIYIGVLFALGGTMILGSLLLWLRPKYLLALTVLLFFGTELLHPAPGQWSTANFGLANLLLAYSGGDSNLWSNYPIVPWLELVTFGLVFGYWLGDDAKEAYDRGLKLGIIFLLAFVALRLFDGFGNIRPRAGQTWIDFLNEVKYPPSMVFTLLTTGFNLIVLWLFSRLSVVRPFLFKPLAIYGRAPLLFYILHLFLFAILGRLFTSQGTTIPKMYFYWIVGLLILYPVCLWYGRFKQRQPVSSAWRLL